MCSHLCVVVWIVLIILVDWSCLRGQIMPISDKFVVFRSPLIELHTSTLLRVQS